MQLGMQDKIPRAAHLSSQRVETGGPDSRRRQGESSFSLSLSFSSPSLALSHPRHKTALM